MDLFHTINVLKFLIISNYWLLKELAVKPEKVSNLARTIQEVLILRILTEHIKVSILCLSYARPWWEKKIYLLQILHFFLVVNK